MQYIRPQLVITLVGLALVGVVLYSQSQGIQTILLPSQGGSYIEAVTGRPTTLNPLLDTDNEANRDLARLLHAGLIRFDGQGLPVADLAQSWAVTADGLAYTFVLRDDIRFSDGELVTIDDVIFTMGLLQDPAFPHSADRTAFWQSVTVVKLNERSLKVELPQPFAPFLDYMTFAVVPEHRLQGVTGGTLDGQPFNFEPVGAGPFIVAGLDVVDGKIVRVAVAPNTNYYGYANGAPFVGEIEFRYFDRADEAVAAYLNSEVLAVGDIPPALMPQVMAAPETALFTTRKQEYDLVFLNQGREELAFFQEKKVRQALLAGLNRQRMVDVLLNGQAVVATGPVLPGTWAYNDNLTTVHYDPDRAANLLDEAGWRFPDEVLPGTADYVRQKDGVVLAFTLTIPETALHQAIAAVMLENWTALGLQVTVDAVPPETLQSEYLLTREYEALYTTFSFAGSPDPDPYPLWHQTQIESGQNYSSYNNRGISELLEQARVNNSISDRASLYAAFQARFTDETPALLLWYPVYNYAVSTRVRGVRVGQVGEPADRFESVAEWYIITRRVVVSQQ